MSNRQASAVILVNPPGQTVQERLVTRAVRASALDLIDALQTAGIEQIIVAGPDLDWLPPGASVIPDPDVEPFHFGARLAGVIERYGCSPVLYFGAGSAPLLPAPVLEQIVNRVRQSDAPLTLTNNLHSSDWIALSHTADALPIIRDAARDNSLAWMLHDSGRFEVQVPADLTPAQGTDLDTPVDLAILAHHAGCSPRLAAALDDSLLVRVPVGAVLDIAARDGGRIALVGRVGPGAWTALSRVTQCWIRAYAEERGMVASERLWRGEVRSLLLLLYDRLGPDGFFGALADVADAAIIDSRVLMAASGHYPTAADRFASDLMLTDAIDDDWVRAFTAAAARASIPILLGGHNVVAGGLHVLAEIVAARRAGGG